MKCKKCGAEIPEGYVYCKVCGNEVQLVPDYNLLDEDLLGDIVQKEGKTESPEPDSPEEGKSKLGVLIWGSIVGVLFLAVLTLFFVCKDVIYRYTSSFDYQYQKAEECFADQDYDNAALHYQKSLEADPGNKKAKKKLCSLFLSMDKTKDAEVLLKELIEADPSDRDSVKKLIALYDADGEYEKILSLCEEAGKEDQMDLFADYLVEQPKFSHISGIYPAPLTVSISSSKGYRILYTMDGRDPTIYGAPYSGDISLKDEKTTVITAVAENDKGIFSKKATVEYTVRKEPPQTPRVTPTGGTYIEPQRITVEVPEDCTAYYTWDGTTPTEGSFRYTAPIEMPQGNQVLSVILVNSFGLKSSVYRVNYVYMP